MLALGVVLTGELIGNFFERIEVPERRRGEVPRLCPLDGVAEYKRDVVAVEGRVFLVSGTEVENLSESAVVAAAAAEYLAAREPAYEYKLVRLRDFKSLAVGLFHRKLYVLRQSLGDRV